MFLFLLGQVLLFLRSIAGWLIFLKTQDIKKYLETSATIITLVLLGNLLEKKSIKKTTNAIRSYLKYKK